MIKDKKQDQRMCINREALVLVGAEGSNQSSSGRNRGIGNKMGRSPCCDENGLKKGPWTPEEDQKLVDYIQKHGHGSWRALPKLAVSNYSLNRCGKSCRLRWTNYLRPDIKRGKFSQDEEQTILHIHSILGNKWSAIASHLPGRTDNEIKNFWNTHLKKKLIQMGFDPMTHQPRTDLFSSLPHLMALVNLKELLENHPLDEHTMRLQAEAVQLAKLQYLQNLVQSAASITTNSYNQNGITDMEVLNLLNSIPPSMKESSSSVLPHLENHASYPLGTATSQPLHHPNTLCIPQLSDPQEVPFSYQPSLNGDEQMAQASSLLNAMVSEGNNNPSDSSWVLPSPAPSAPPTATETSMSNPGDASSTTSSYGGGTASSSYWSELFFEDSVMHEIS